MSGDNDALLRMAIDLSLPTEYLPMKRKILQRTTKDRKIAEDISEALKQEEINASRQRQKLLVVQGRKKSKILKKYDNTKKKIRKKIQNESLPKESLPKESLPKESYGIQIGLGDESCIPIYDTLECCPDHRNLGKENNNNHNHIGKRIRMYQENGSCVKGEIQDQNKEGSNSRYFVEFDNGSAQWINIKEHPFEWIETNKLEKRRSIQQWKARVGKKYCNETLQANNTLAQSTNLRKKIKNNVRGGVALQDNNVFRTMCQICKFQKKSIFYCRKEQGHLDYDWNCNEMDNMCLPTKGTSDGNCKDSDMKVDSNANQKHPHRSNLKIRNSSLDVMEDDTQGIGVIRCEEDATNQVKEEFNRTANITSIKTHDKPQDQPRDQPQDQPQDQQQESAMNKDCHFSENDQKVGSTWNDNNEMGRRIFQIGPSNPFKLWACMQRDSCKNVLHISTCLYLGQPVLLICEEDNLSLWTVTNLMWRSVYSLSTTELSQSLRLSRQWDLLDTADIVETKDGLGCAVLIKNSQSQVLSLSLICISWGKKVEITNVVNIATIHFSCMKFKNALFMKRNNESWTIVFGESNGIHLFLLDGQRLDVISQRRLSCRTSYSDPIHSFYWQHKTLLGISNSEVYIWDLKKGDLLNVYEISDLGRLHSLHQTMLDAPIVVGCCLQGKIHFFQVEEMQRDIDSVSLHDISNYLSKEEGENFCLMDFTTEYVVGITTLGRIVFWCRKTQKCVAIAGEMMNCLLSSTLVRTTRKMAHPICPYKFHVHQSFPLIVLIQRNSHIHLYATDEAISSLPSIT